MENTQPKFKWHNEVIAWLNGETIEFKWPEYNDDWAWTNITKHNNSIPAFREDWEYRIKPKEVVKYAGIYETSTGVGLSDAEQDSIEQAQKYMAFNQSNSKKFQKRTYLNGELIALELVKV